MDELQQIASRAIGNELLLRGNCVADRPKNPCSQENKPQLKLIEDFDFQLL